MRIDTHAVCYNEEKILPYFLRHYLQYGKVFLYDNYSTDNSVKIAQEAGATVIPYDSDGKLNDLKYIEIKNNCWKGSDADWVIVGDCDEFVYHKDLAKYLENSTFTAYEPTWYEMFSEEFPTTDGQIYDVVKQGYEAWPKFNLFKPKEFTEINYEIGCHLCKPEGNNILNYAASEIVTLHMRHLGKQYIIDRNGMYAKRLSDVNIQNKWGWHLAQTPEEISEGFDKEFKITRKVI
jgi:glycosyltransferase involved in cell wall biosynthesis